MGGTYKPPAPLIAGCRLNLLGTLQTPDIQSLLPGTKPFFGLWRIDKVVPLG